MEGNLRFKIDWASLIAGSKLNIFPSFYFVLEGNFPSKSPQGLILTEGFLRYRFGGLIFRGAYFRNFTVSNSLNFSCFIYFSNGSLTVL